MLLADATSAASAAVPQAPGVREVLARAAGENFPVASILLPRRVRAHLLAVYGFARLVDELGDSVPGDRVAALDWLEGELDAAFAERAEHPLMRRLSQTVSACGLTRDPFARLIEANRADQRTVRYATWEQLRGYCALSADPVGEIVLQVFGVATPERISLSDSICTALQLTEHCQDVAEDYLAGRVYLPAEDMARFGCVEADLDPSPATRAGRDCAALHAVLAFEVRRARELLRDGAPLLRTLRGRERIAVAAFVAGGHAALDAIERAGCEVLSGPPQAGRWRRLLALRAVLSAAS